MTSQKLATKNRALKIAIVDAAITQRRLAKRARIDETKLSRIISGEVLATPKEQKTIARILQRSIDELFSTPDAEAVAS
jgi:transcriptional regulator with XRE-family HTH domain